MVGFELLILIVFYFCWTVAVGLYSPEKLKGIVELPSPSETNPTSTSIRANDINKQYISIVNGAPVSSYSPPNPVENSSYIPPVSIGNRKLSRRNLHGVSSLTEEDKLNLLHSDSYYDRMHMQQNGDENEEHKVDFSDRIPQRSRSRSFCGNEKKDSSDSQSSQGISERKKKAGLFPNFFSSTFHTTTTSVKTENACFVSTRKGSNEDTVSYSVASRKHSVNTYFTRTSVDGIKDTDKDKDKLSEDTDFDKYKDVHAVNRNTLRQDASSSQNHPSLLHIPHIPLPDKHHLRAIATTLTSPFISHKWTPRSSVTNDPNSPLKQKNVTSANLSQGGDRSPLKSSSGEGDSTGAKNSSDKDSSAPSYTYGIAHDSKSNLEVILESSKHSAHTNVDKKVEMKEISTQTDAASNVATASAFTTRASVGTNGIRQHELSIVLSPMAFVLIAFSVVSSLYVFKHEEFAIILGIPSTLYILIFLFHR